MDAYNQILQLLQDSGKDVVKFEKGNASAGRRLRKTLLAISKLTKEARVQIQKKLDAE